MLFKHKVEALENICSISHTESSRTMNTLSLECSHSTYFFLPFLSGRRLIKWLSLYTRFNRLWYLPHCIFVQIIFKIIEKFDNASAFLEWIQTTGIWENRNFLVKITSIFAFWWLIDQIFTTFWIVSYSQRYCAVANVLKSWCNPDSNSPDFQCEQMSDLAIPNHWKWNEKRKNN